MDMERIDQITRERIAASQEQAVRDLVRTNQMLVDEVDTLRDALRRLQASVHDQNPECPCEGCVWWNDWGFGSPNTHCENSSTPDPWHAAAVDGGVPGCPNFSPQRPHNPIKPTIEIELLKFKDGIRHIDACSIGADEIHRLKNQLASVYADHIARLIEEQLGTRAARATGDDGCRKALTLERSYDKQTAVCYEEVK